MKQATAEKHEDWEDAWLNSGNDPYLFATGVLGFLPAGAPNPNRQHQLEHWQDEFLREFPTSPRHSIVSGHGTGKGTVLAILALWFPLTHYDSKAVVSANSQDQLRDNNWPEIKKWATKLPLPLREQLDLQEERITLKAAPEMAFVVRRTASKSNPEALQGIHALHVLYLIDEASGIVDVVFEVAQGSLSTPGAIAVLFSNGTRSSGFFYDTHHRMRDRWKCRTVSSEDVPRARGHIADVIALYGKNSNKYRVRVAGQFPTHDDETVIPLEQILSAQGRDVQISAVWPVWGVDVARFGDDTSTLVKRQGNSLKYDDGRPPIFEWLSMDGAQVAGRIQAEYRATPTDHRPREIVVDVIGVGASVYAILRLEGSEVREIVRGANVAELPASSEEDHRLRDELWFRGAKWFSERQCHFPKTLPTPEHYKLVEKLISELAGPTYDFTHGGKRIVESKRDMKKRGLPSPNLADGFLLTFAAGVHSRIRPHHRIEHDATPSWRAA